MFNHFELCTMKTLIQEEASAAIGTGGKDSELTEEDIGGCFGYVMIINVALNRVFVRFYSGVITIGREKESSRSLISREDVVGYLQEHQKSRISISGVYLNASVSSCDIVLNNQIEPHLKMEFSRMRQLYWKGTVGLIQGSCSDGRLGGKQNY